MISLAVVKKKSSTPIPYYSFFASLILYIFLQFIQEY